MKTINELYNEIMADETLRKEYFDAVDNGSTEEFLKAHGCEANAEEVEEFLSGKGRKSGELSDDELDDVAAGKKCGTIYKDGRPVVTTCNGCKHFRCGNCKKPDAYAVSGWCRYCMTHASCNTCTFCKYTGGLWICYNDVRINN